MLEFAKLVHDAIGVESPRTFIAIFALFGLVSFAVLGYLIDRAYRMKLREEAATQKPEIIATGKAGPKPLNTARATSVPRHPSVGQASRSQILVTVQDGNGLPVSGAQVLLVAPNGTHSNIGVTDASGTANLLKPAAAPVDIYCAHHQFPAYLQKKYSPGTPIEITLSHQQRIGSIIQAGIGNLRIPELDGTIDPRTYPSTYPNAGQHYLYTTNLSVNGHVESLFPFEIGVPLAIEDNSGHRVQLELIASNSECFLMQYRQDQ
jgi:hypothetical protein